MNPTHLILSYCEDGKSVKKYRATLLRFNAFDSLDSTVQILNSYNMEGFEEPRICSTYSKVHFFETAVGKHQNSKFYMKRTGNLNEYYYPFNELPTFNQIKDIACDHNAEFLHLMATSETSDNAYRVSIRGEGETNGNNIIHSFE